MKRNSFIALFLSFLFLGTKIGVALNAHFCGATLAEISFAHHPKKCDMENDAMDHLPNDQMEVVQKSCCSDTVLLLQNQEPQKDFKVPTYTTNIAALAVFIPTDKNNIGVGNLNVDFTRWIPPPPKKQSNYLLYHQFIFYG